jgi:hypothetical protein
MTARTDTTTDRLQGACPAFGTGDFWYGICLRFAGTGNAGVLSFSNDDVPTGNFISMEITGGQIKLFGDAGATDAFTFATGTDYYFVIGRGAVFTDKVAFRLFTLVGGATPAFTSNGDAVTADANLSLSLRTIGTAFGNPAADLQCEAEKAELGYELTNAEAWAEAQKYLLQRAGGTAELTVGLTTHTDLTDTAGTAQNLTNTGCVTGANHPDFLEILGEEGADATGTSGFIGGVLRQPSRNVSVFLG